MEKAIQVDIFIPCFIDQLFPETGINMVKVLEKLGCTVHYNKNQTCCGQPSCNSGFQDEARAIAKKFCKDFGHSEHYIVAPSGSCVGYIANQYDHLLKNAAEYNTFKKIKPRLFEFADFLVTVLQTTSVNAVFPAKATYHDGCGSLRECHIKSQPRQLLEQVKGLSLTEMKECETCCGFGGTFAVKYETISIGMAQTKVESALAVDAEYIISSDLSCLMHLDAYIKKQNIPLKTMHIADILASGL
ncbi:Fe-S oxidoreductase [Taibaiella sp. KBW10]|uniref:(Fe-S)-binding protein n=1 Tax=Taibaiella sp. KBW10 TaxID=2153357 RepID=UPI000F58FB94|nr:(Fe-S)-binding protein [Taibaiella sp. KBW10]RQO31032.1 Fe-S oxidoreductase [Taibaiella sp. KBW10]